MKKITRRNFLIASGKTVGTLAAASAFMGCASPEQAENCFPRSGMPVRTDDRLTAIDDIVENYMGQGYFPGATIVVARGGKIVYEKAYGYAMLNDMGVRLDDPRPMQMDTMFDMASCTKIMATTQSIMKLYSEGKIDLNATVASYIPEFAKNGKENVTVHQLLTHTSGLPQWKAMFLYIEKDKAKVLDYICNCELMFAPGEEKYSDLGFQMLGFLVERITGRSMDEYVKKKFKKPFEEVRCEEVESDFIEGYKNYLRSKNIESMDKPDVFSIEQTLEWFIDRASELKIADIPYSCKA